MIELNFDNQLARQIRFCRRIVADGTEITDKQWEEKLKQGAGNRELILHNSKTQISKGFRVVEEHKRGEDMNLGERRNSDGSVTHAVHICKREEDGRYYGHINGMWYIWIPVGVDLDGYKRTLDGEI